MNHVTVTTSWDDGSVHDIRLANLLKKYGIKATFYISPKSHELSTSQRLTKDNIRDISQDFEIGAHTITHPHLSKIAKADAEGEIKGSKELLEKIIHKPVKSFCYPYGDYTNETKTIVKNAGFERARTVKRFSVQNKDDFALQTSVDTFDHLRDGLWTILKLHPAQPWLALKLRRWDNLAKEMFEQARMENGVFHLWGHSHEIDAHNDWERLEKLLSWIASQENVTFASNIEIPIAPLKVIVTSPYFKPRSGGLEEYAYQTTKGLQDTFGWDVAVVTSGDKQDPEFSEYNGLKVYHLPTLFKLSNTPIGFTWSRRMKKIFKVEKPDVIVAHAPVAGMLDVTARFARKIPVVVVYHMGSMKKGRPFMDILVWLYEHLILPFTLKNVQLIISTSQFIVQTFISKRSTKSYVINPGVDTQLFKPTNAHRKGHNILHIGGLSSGEDHKGLATTLRIVTQLKRNYSDIQLTVVGDGDQLSSYKALAKKLGIAKIVRFTGRLDRRMLAAEFNKSDLLLVPSQKESFGMVILEAMASGVPVVASNAEGIPELVSSGYNGILVNSGDINEYVTKVKQIFDDEAFAKSLSENGRKSVKEKYLWEDKIRQMDKALRNILLGDLAVKAPKKMKILFVTSGSARSNYTYRSLALAKSLSRLGHETALISPRADKYNHFKTELISEVDGVRILQPFQFVTKRLEINLIPYMIDAIRIILKERPDLVYIYKPTPISVVGLVSKFFRGTTTFLDMDDLGAEVMRIEGHPAYQRLLVSWSERASARFADKLVVCSTYLQDMYRMKYPDKPSYLLPNGVESDWFVPVYPSTGKRTIVFFGALNRSDIVEPLIDVLPEAIKKYPDLQFILVGGGQYLEYIQQKVKKLGISKNVEFTGYLHPVDKALPYLREGDIGYSYMPDDPTVRAASRMKLPQYMSRGVVPFVSNVGDLPFVVGKDSAGYIVKPDDKDALLKGLLSALGDKDRLNKSRKARHFAQERLDWDKLAEGFNDWLQEPNNG